MTSSCAICAGSDRSVLAPFSDWLERAANFTDARRKYASIIQASPGLRPDQFVRCNSCGFIVVNPLPDESALTCFYQHNESTVLYLKKRTYKIATGDAPVESPEKNHAGWYIYRYWLQHRFHCRGGTAAGLRCYGPRT